MGDNIGLKVFCSFYNSIFLETEKLARFLRSRTVLGIEKVFI